MSELEFRTAIREALDEELTRDASVILFGEDVAVAGGVFAVTTGLHERHGSDRVIDTPISELAMSGAAYGAAICGLRPVLEIMFGDFLPLAMDSILNQAAKFLFLAGEHGVPLVVRCVVGAGGRFGAIHSQTPIPWFQGVTGIKLVAPSTPADAKGLLRAAIQDANPVLFFEHKRLYSTRGPAGDGKPIALGTAAVVRDGSDVTIATAMKGVHDALRAADRLADEHGIHAEVIDLRTIRPLDVETVVASVGRTNRLVVLEEGPLTGGWAGELVARVVEEALDELDDAWRITTPDGPVPYSPPLEDAFLPGPDRIVAEITARS
jgi:pyruvate/2-oxoglutarate/acetoin dehydrogenase E1 component